MTAIKVVLDKRFWACVGAAILMFLGSMVVFAVGVSIGAGILYVFVTFIHPMAVLPVLLLLVFIFAAGQGLYEEGMFKNDKSTQTD